MQDAFPRYAEGRLIPSQSFFRPRVVGLEAAQGGAPRFPPVTRKSGSGHRPGFHFEALACLAENVSPWYLTMWKWRRLGATGWPQISQGKAPADSATGCSSNGLLFRPRLARCFVFRPLEPPRRLPDFPWVIEFKTVFVLQANTDRWDTLGI